jgi:hypothetical protein
MSQIDSQFSNAYSSVFDVDLASDTFSFPPATENTPDPSCSQRTFDSAFDSTFAIPLQPYPLPSTLKRVGSDKKKPFVLWTEMTNNEFVQWWLTTDFGRGKKRNLFEAERRASCWKHFDQVADIKDGTPKVMCKRCGTILHHPANSHQGTSSMNKHYTRNVSCQNAAAKKPNIKQLMRNGVSYSYKYSQKPD